VLLQDSRRHLAAAAAAAAAGKRPIFVPEIIDFSLQQTHALYQIRETRVRVKRIHVWINFDPRQVEGALSK